MQTLWSKEFGIERIGWSTDKEKGLQGEDCIGPWGWARGGLESVLESKPPWSDPTLPAAHATSCGVPCCAPSSCNAEEHCFQGGSSLAQASLMCSLGEGPWKLSRFFLDQVLSENKVTPSGRSPIKSSNIFPDKTH